MKAFLLTLALMLTAALAFAQDKTTSQNPLPTVSADRLTVVVGPSYDWNIVTATRGPSPAYSKNWTLNGQFKYQLTDGTNTYLPNQRAFLFSTVAYTAQDRLRKPLSGNIGIGLQLWGPKAEK